jgi:flagellar hook-basal body complex protein FliE
MVDAINKNGLIESISGPGKQPAGGDSGKQAGLVSFGEFLNRSIQQVDHLQQEADSAARQLVSGENKDIHGTMIAMQKAGIAMDLMLEVRNKVISAYEEIKRMQF